MNKRTIAINPQSDIEVKVIECGPLRIKGNIPIIRSNGSVIVKHRAFICRCGRSKTNPFCDGSHSYNHK